MRGEIKEMGEGGVVGETEDEEKDVRSKRGTRKERSFEESSTRGERKIK